LTKEILAEIGILGIPLPRCLLIPMIPTLPETDLLNIQMSVMEMLSDDPEISKLVASYWNLGFEIKAFNVQKQVWDLLDPDDDLELPPRASIQVNITNNDPDDEVVRPAPVIVDTKNVSRRDPRRKHREVESQLNTSQDEEDVRLPVQAPVVTSQRDPRRKIIVTESEPEVNININTAAIENVQAVQTNANAKSAIPEPNVNNLSRNDPRRRKLLEKTGHDAHISRLSPRNVGKRTLSQDSDSDEGGLQIDETIEDKHPIVNVTNNMITESQLEEIHKPEVLDSSSNDIELWDEIYKIDDPSEPPVKAAPVVSTKKVQEKPVEIVAKDVSLEKDDKSKPVYFDERKTLDQLERERELLLSLVKERDRMNEIVASVPVPPPEEITLDNDDDDDEDLEEGELTDSSEHTNDDNSAKDNDSDIEIVNEADGEKPTNEVEITRGRSLSFEKEKTPSRPIVDPDEFKSPASPDDFVSPASPTGIQLDLDNDEIDVIPLEREELIESSETTIGNMDRNRRGSSEVVEIIPDNKDKYKHYWDEFPDDSRPDANHREVELFEVAKQKLKNKFNRQSDDDISPNKKPSMMELFQKATKNISPKVPTPDTSKSPDQPKVNFDFEKMRSMPLELKKPQGPPPDLFLRATQGITPLIGHQPRKETQQKVTQMSIPGPAPVPAIRPRFPPPMPSLRKGIALLDTPVFPQPVKAVDSPLSSTPSPLSSRMNSPSQFNASQPTNPNFSLPPPSLSRSSSYNSPSPVTKTISNSPSSLTKKISDSPTPVKKIPSLMQVQVTPPHKDELNPPKQNKTKPNIPPTKSNVPATKPNVWKDGWSPNVKKSQETKTSSPTGAQANNMKEKSVNKRNRSPVTSKTQDNKKSLRKNSPRREQRRSRSRDRDKRRSRSRDNRARESNNKERRSIRSTRSRSRERDRRRRSGSRDKSSVSRSRRSKSGDRVPSGKSRSIRSRTRSGDKTKNKMQESDNLMLAFYEGGDFMDDEQETSSSNSRTKHPSGSTGPKSDQSKPGPSTANFKPSTFTSKPSASVSKPSTATSKPPTMTPKPSTLASRAQSAVNKFPEPTPTVTMTTFTQDKKSFPEPVKASGNFFMSSLSSANQRQNSPMRFSSIGPSQNAPRSQGTPTRGEVIGATLNLTTKHPVSALYEYNRSMKYPAPKFKDRWGPGGGWAFDVELGPHTYSCPWFRDNKKSAKAEACKYALQQLGIHIP